MNTCEYNKNETNELIWSLISLKFTLNECINEELEESNPQEDHGQCYWTGKWITQADDGYMEAKEKHKKEKRGVVAFLELTKENGSLQRSTTSKKTSHPVN